MVSQKKHYFFTIEAIGLPEIALDRRS